MSSTITGQSAEKAVAEKLQQIGFKVLARNWKTAVCEIDIVAKKDDIIYFVEVKYRSGEAQGGGMEYIGPQKIRKIGFAAQVWTQHHDWEGDYRLLGAEVSGRAAQLIKFVEIDS